MESVIKTRAELITWMTSDDAADVSWNDQKYWEENYNMSDDKVMELDDMAADLEKTLNTEHGSLTQNDIDNGVNFSDKLSAMVDAYIATYSEAVND